MTWIDTHTHLYDSQYVDDIDTVVQRAIDSGVEKMLLPNCDHATIAPMMELSQLYPDHCYPMIGLHPTYVNEQYMEQLAQMQPYLNHKSIVAVGEIGLDFYWDTTYQAQQYEAFEIQIDWALAHDLPIAIHTRSSIDDAIEVIRRKQNGALQGVFHCFGGDVSQAKQIIDLGFYLGLGGVLTFKNSNLRDVVNHIPLDRILLETDAPYLAPVPYRGKRNESSYIPLIGAYLADLFQISEQELAKVTTDNAHQLFKRLK